MKYTKHNQKKLKWILAGLFLAFASLHFASVVIDRSLYDSWLKTFAMNFDLDREKVAPAIYTSLLLAGCGVLAVEAVSAESLKRRKAIWWLLGSFFIYLSLDELFIVHEQLAEPLRDLLSIGNSSLLYHAWVIPATVAVALGLGASLFALRRHLVSNAQINIIFLLSLLVIIDVALEAVGTKFYGSQSLYRYVSVSAEEMFEIGMISYIFYQLYSVNIKPKK